MRAGAARNVCAALLGALLGVAPAASGQQASAPAASGARLFVLQFNRWGELLTPGDVQLAASNLAAAPEISRILIFSYGWANDAEASHAAYLEMLRDFSTPGEEARGEVAVIAVGWDSSQSGFRGLFNNLIPLPGVADALAWVPDKLLFPISFWSKAANADRIGLGELRAALNQILRVYADREDHPEIFLVGHSFGARILSALMLEHLGVIPVQAEPFIGAPYVKGAFLLQPAAIPLNLHRDAPYPVVVTMSRHDHANGFLFPVANVPLNAFGFTAFEVMIRNRIIGPVTGTVRFTFDTVGSILTAPLPDRKKKEEKTGEDAEPASFEPVRRIPRRSRIVLRRTLAEVAAIPAAFAFTLVGTPLNYLYVQGVGLATRPADHVMDTLAQIPLVEIPVHGLGRLLGREVPWGQRGKGFLTLGPLQEATGRMLVPTALGTPIDPPVWPDEMFASGKECGLVVCTGVLMVDASSLVREGLYGEDLERPVWDFTLGWLDPIGAHGDFRNAEVADLLRRVLEEVSTGEAAP